MTDGLTSLADNAWEDWNTAEIASGEIARRAVDEVSEIADQLQEADE